MVIGAVLVFWRFPGKEEEQRLLQEYATEDAQPPQPRELTPA